MPIVRPLWSPFMTLPATLKFLSKSLLAKSNLPDLRFSLIALEDILLLLVSLRINPISSNSILFFSQNILSVSMFPFLWLPYWKSLPIKILLELSFSDKILSSNSL